MERASGLVEALLALHTPTKTWGIGSKPDGCRQCHTTYPCPTVVLVAEVTGSPVPEERTTACDGAVPSEDGEGFLMCLLDAGHHADGSHCKGQDGREAPWPYMTMEEALFGG